MSKSSDSQIAALKAALAATQGFQNPKMEDDGLLSLALNQINEIAKKAYRAWLRRQARDKSLKIMLPMTLVVDNDCFIHIKPRFGYPIGQFDYVYDWEHGVVNVLQYDEESELVTKQDKTPLCYKADKILGWEEWNPTPWSIRTEVETSGNHGGVAER